MTRTAAGTVELFPLAIARKYFKFEITALGSARSLVLTPDETIALKFLRREKVVAKAEARLVRYNARTDVSYADLVDRLVAAGLVHRLDGREIERPYAPWTRVVSDGVARGIAALPGTAAIACEKVGSRVLPVSVMFDLNRAAIGASMRRSRRANFVKRVSANMRRLLGDLPEAQLTQYAERALEHALRLGAELTLLNVAPEDKVCRWLLRTITKYDVGTLREALARGKGALVFHYHIGPIQYVPALLSALGFELTLLGMSMRPKSTKQYFSVVDDLRPAGVMKLLRALQRGEVVVMAPDLDLRIAGGNAAADDRDSMFAGVWHKASTLPIAFLGQPIEAYTGLAWLREQSGAPLVFASVDRDDRGDVSLTCAPFHADVSDAATSRERIERTMRLVYRHYERELVARPDQWMHWPTFFKRHVPAN